MGGKRLALFGGEKKWDAADWTASDDRVRGGSSQSYLECSDSDSIAEFHGNLDIDTLGGAGFASQRTTGENRSWDLSAYDGIELSVEKADAKKHTFILKDELLSKNPENGREQATISFEYDFTVPQSDALSSGHIVFIPWKELKPTYRGKEKKDASDIDLTTVKRFSLMMRSFFGTQKGKFSLSLRSIAAVSRAKEDGTRSSPPVSTGQSVADQMDLEAAERMPGEKDPSTRSPPAWNGSFSSQSARDTGLWTWVIGAAVGCVILYLTVKGWR